MSIESVMPSNHLILCCPLLPMPSIFSSIRVFSNESALCIRWPKYWSFSFSLVNEYSGLVSFWIDCLISLLSKGFSSLLQHHISKAPIPQLSGFLMVQLSHPIHDYWKSHSFGYFNKVISLLFNTLSRIVITFFPRNKCVLISWLQSSPVVILEPKKSATVYAFFPICFPWSDGTGCHDLSFFEWWVLSQIFTLFFHLHQEAL